MSDAIAGLVGVIVGGLITYGASYRLVRRREKRDARAARRIVLSELSEAAQAVRGALDAEEWPTGWTRKAWSESWSTYRAILAVDIDDDEKFAAVASAYLYMGLLETGLAAEKRPFVHTDRPFLNDVSQRTDAALAALSAKKVWSRNVEERRSRMKTGYEKAKRIVEAAQAVLDTEAYWSAGESAPGPYQTDMRDLKTAVDDYLSYREKSWRNAEEQNPPQE